LVFLSSFFFVIPKNTLGLDDSQAYRHQNLADAESVFSSLSRCIACYFAYPDIFSAHKVLPTKLLLPICLPAYSLFESKQLVRSVISGTQML